MERTIIQVATHPITTTFPDYDVAAAKDISNVPYSGGWNLLLATQLMKESTGYTYECWAWSTSKKDSRGKKTA